MQPDGDRPALWTEIRALQLAAMAVFVYTIGIGILNGTDMVDFDQRRILGHVHGGTLGWLTLNVFAASPAIRMNRALISSSFPKNSPNR